MKKYRGFKLGDVVKCYNPHAPGENPQAVGIITKLGQSSVKLKLIRGDCCAWSYRYLEYASKLDKVLE